MPNNHSLASSVCPEFVSHKSISVHPIRVVLRLETSKMLGNEVLTRTCGSGISAARALADVSEAREKTAVSFAGPCNRALPAVSQCEREKNPRASPKRSRG